MTSAPCPICRRPPSKDFSPFCSRRCADVDLQRWFSGSYVVPGAPEEDDDNPAAEDDEG